MVILIVCFLSFFDSCCSNCFEQFMDHLLVCSFLLQKILIDDFLVSHLVLMNEENAFRAVKAVFKHCKKWTKELEKTPPKKISLMSTLSSIIGLPIYLRYTTTLYKWSRHTINMLGWGGGKHFLQVFLPLVIIEE